MSHASTGGSGPADLRPCCESAHKRGDPSGFAARERTRLGSPGRSDPRSFATDALKYLVFKNPAWDFRNLDMRSYKDVAGKINSGYSPMNPNLQSYFKNHGK